jgi:hypothetical protein
MAATIRVASTSRKKLLQGVKKGNVTLDGLRNVASRALSELSNRKSAWDFAGQFADQPTGRNGCFIRMG